MKCLQSSGCSAGGYPMLWVVANAAVDLNQKARCTFPEGIPGYVACSVPELIKHWHLVMQERKQVRRGLLKNNQAVLWFNYICCNSAMVLSCIYSLTIRGYLFYTEHWQILPIQQHLPISLLRSRSVQWHQPHSSIMEKKKYWGWKT